MKSNRGSGTFLALSIMVAIFVFVLTAIIYAEPRVGDVVETLPNSVEIIFNTFFKVGELLTRVLLNIVAPSDLAGDDNLRVIAASIFLLITLVGTQSLKSFFRNKNQSFLPFVISVAIALIASRSLTSTILNTLDLGASPLTAIALLVGVVPILMISNSLERFSATGWTKMALYSLTALFYFFVTLYIFETSVVLSLFYAVAVLVLGIGQVMIPLWREHAQQQHWHNLGKYMQQTHKDVGIIEGMYEASKEGNIRGR